MNKDLIIALLALAFAGAAAALLVTLAKLQEEKGRRWDEISRAVGLENELEKGKIREKCQAQSVFWFADQLKYWKQANDDKTRSIQFCHAEYAKLRDERDALQDFKSSKLCPHNDHIWIDGVCKRCGRIQDANARRVRDEKNI